MRPTKGPAKAEKWVGWWPPREADFPIFPPVSHGKFEPRILHLGPLRFSSMSIITYEASIRNRKKKFGLIIGIMNVNFPLDKERRAAAT